MFIIETWWYSQLYSKWFAAILGQYLLNLITKNHANGRGVLFLFFLFLVTRHSMPSSAIAITLLLWMMDLDWANWQKLALSQKTSFSSATKRTCPANLTKIHAAPTLWIGCTLMLPQFFEPTSLPPHEASSRKITCPPMMICLFNNFWFQM